MIIALLIFLFTDTGGNEILNNRLERSGYGQGDREEQLILQVEKETETELLTFRIQEQKYTKEQAEALLEEACLTLEQQILGENLSRDEVRTALVLPSVLEEGAVKLEWVTVPYGIIAEDGSINGEPEETGTMVELQGRLSCQEQELVYETAVCV